MKHDIKNVQYAGKPAEEAEKAVILIHGRGATAESILGLMNEFRLDDALYAAPQATNNAWYPYSFMEDTDRNQPWLDFALELIDDLVAELEKKGFSKDKIVLMGFSQGACLATEYACRNATRFGAVIAFSGGLIGSGIKPETYNGDFNGTPVFLGCSDVDFHIPEPRVHETNDQFERLKADVETVIYAGMGHTINQDEILRAQRVLDKA